MKNASQIGENINHNSKTYPASNAVDGKTDSAMRNKRCAHPMTDNDNMTAWWKVDLYDTYRLFSVVIYNRDIVPYRLDGFTLSVGTRSDQLVPCGTHIGPVKPSASVTTSCEAVGRYLEFRRNITTRQPNIGGLCEVVVIGHLYISKYKTQWLISFVLVLLMKRRIKKLH